MHWKKLGQIFNPTKHNLNFEVSEFAQSPQAIELEDRIRVYFSTRIKDKSNQFLSKIEFVDYDKNFENIIGNSFISPIPLGKLGTFDEHGIFPFSPVKVGEEIWAYTCGWSRRVSVPVETSTGLAKSKDQGLSFEKHGNGPIFSNSLHEPFLVGDSFVRQYNNIFYMWYIFGTKWIAATENEPEARVYKIGQVTSINGIDFGKQTGNSIISDLLDENECQALPSIAYFKNKYHMVFCYRYATDFRNNPKRGYRIGYAWSDDLTNWNRESNSGLDISEKDWDSEMQCYPNLIVINDKLYLLYNGNAFGKEGFGLAEFNK